RVASASERIETAPAVVTLQQVKDAWPEILEAVEKAKRTAWMVVFTAKPLDLREGNILDLSFASQGDVDALKQRTTPGEGVADYLKQAVFDVLGFRPLLTARAESARPVVPPAVQQERVQQEPPEPTEPDIEPPVPSGITWETAVVTDSEPQTKPAPEAPNVVAQTAAVAQRAEPPAPKRAPPVAMANGKQRYGESVVREILGASFIEEQDVAPRVAPREL
ncbi:MAG: polymerase subunit gamma/tau, partial [Microbacteriaceae bacterium]|nr:polymerase subunit gamma/tau [Microbacteriaceae bacterium]